MNDQPKPQFRSGMYANEAHPSQGFNLLRNGDTVVVALYGYKPPSEPGATKEQFWATGSARIVADADGVAASMYQVSGAHGGNAIASAVLRPQPDGSIDVDCDFTRSINGPVYRNNFKPIFYC